MEKILFLAGLLPLLIFCVAVMRKKKRYQCTIPVLGVTAVIAILVCVWPTQEELSQVSGEKLNYLMEHSLEEEDFEKAEEYLNQLYQSFGDIPEVARGQLRLAILQEDMEEAVFVAKAILAGAMQNQLGLVEAEEKFLEEVQVEAFESAEAYKRDRAICLSAAENGIALETYGIQEVSEEMIAEAEKREEKLRKKVADAIEASVENFETRSSTEPFADACRVVEKLEQVLNGEAESLQESSEKEVEKKIKKYLGELDELYGEDEEILLVSEFGNLFIDACIRVEEYEPLMKYAAASKTESALATVAYLYMAEEIRERDLEEFFPAKDYDSVMELCEAVYDRLEDELEDEETAELLQYEEYLEAVDNRRDNQVLAAIEESLTGSLTQSGGNAAGYLQSAAINGELQDKKRTFENLDRAIDAKEACADEKLGEVLEKLGSIRDKTAEEEEILRFNDYLVESYERSLPIAAEQVVVPETFLNTGNLYINEKRSKINIGLLDTENFPVMRAYISAVDVDLKEQSDLIISDCGILIEDYKIEKVRYDSAQIMLVCDNSGSMSGDVELLKEAVRKFIETRKKGETIGIVTFDSGILQNVALTKEEEVLLQAVEQFTALGGTCIRNGVDAAMQQYEQGESFKVMIVMTDGQDSSYYGAQFEELRNACLEKNVILYTIGLGSVSADYLKKMADSGMGSFVYCNNSVQLEELYSFIHNQMENNYVLTYRAVDTNTLENRVLTVSSTSEGYSAAREYSIEHVPQKDVQEPEDGRPETDEKEAVTDETEIGTNPAVYVQKLGISKIVKGSNFTALEQDFTILGSGFETVGNITVSLKGQRLYAGLEVAVSSDSMLRVVLPQNVECDTYTVLVNADGVTYTLQGLTVTRQTDKTEIQFGDYVFKADRITEGYGEYILSGNVVMNDYLHFKGDIKLSGGLDGTMLVLTDRYGSYMEGTGKLPGILADFFDNKVSVPKLDGLSIYKDDTYDKFYTRSASFYGPLEIVNPNIELHPEYLKYYISEINLDFPLLDKILEYAESPISVKGFENSIILSKDRMGFVLNVEAGSLMDKSAKLGPAKLSIDSVKLAVNTFQHNYDIGLGVKMEDVPVFGDKETTYGLEIGIASGKFNSIDLGADIDLEIVKVPVAGVPLTLVTLNDFHVGVSDLVAQEQNGEFASKFLNSTIYGQTDVDFFNLGKVIPGVDALLGDFLDIAILKLDDTKAGLHFKNLRLTLDAKAVLLEMAELGRVEATVGNYSYQNYLLGIDQSTVGIYFQTSSDYELQFGNWFNAGTDGLTRVDVSGAFAGAMMRGGIHYNIDVFGKHIGDMNGTGILGLHNNASQFTILLKGTDYVSQEAIGFRISFSNGNLWPSFECY